MLFEKRETFLIFSLLSSAGTGGGSQIIVDTTRKVSVHLKVGALHFLVVLFYNTPYWRHVPRLLEPDAAPFFKSPVVQDSRVCGHIYGESTRNERLREICTIKTWRRHRQRNLPHGVSTKRFFFKRPFDRGTFHSSDKSSLITRFQEKSSGKSSGKSSVMTRFQEAMHKSCTLSMSCCDLLWRFRVP